MNKHPSGRTSLPVATTGEDALDVAIRLAQQAGALVSEAAKRPRPYERKGRNNFVTETDHSSEELILSGLVKAFPDHALLSEESYPDIPWAEGELWVVDPLDGTRNYSAGIPFFSMVTGYALQCPALCRSRLPCWGSADRRSPSRQPR